MSYKLEIINKRDYLHAIVSGDNTEENVRRYLEELLQECDKFRIRSVLIEERLTGARLANMSVFDIVSQGSEKSRGHFKAIAYVDFNAEGLSMKNAEAFASNRGLNVRVFRKTDEAETWLMDFV